MSGGAPPVQRLGSAVLIQGAAVAELAHLALLGARARRQLNGAEPSAGTLAMLQLLADAGMARSRHDDVAEGADRPELGAMDQVSTKEAAQMLGLSHRQTQRIAADFLGARRVGGALVMDRGAVDAYAAQRAEREAAR